MARSKKLSGLNPLAYVGVEPSTPPQVVIERRRPTTNDYSEYNIGTFWLWIDDQEAWLLISKSGGIATWVMIYPASGGGGTSTYITDAGSANSVDGDINLVGGSNINTTGTGDIVTVGLNHSISVTGSVSAGGNVYCVGLHSGAIINTDDIDTGGKLTAGTGVDISAGGIDSTGTTRFRDFGAGILQSDATGTVTSSNGANGQVLVGGGTDPSWANITSTGGTITVTDGANSINLEQTGGPIQPNVAFMAYYATEERFPQSMGSAFHALGSITALTEKFDLANAFFPGDGAGNGAKFTVPITGKYCLCGNISIFSTYDNFKDARIHIITPSATFESMRANVSTRTGYKNMFEICIDLTAGDVVTYELFLGPLSENLVLGTDSGVLRSWLHGFLVD